MSNLIDAEYIYRVYPHSDTLLRCICDTYVYMYLASKVLLTVPAVFYTNCLYLHKYSHASPAYGKFKA